MKSFLTLTFCFLFASAFSQQTRKKGQAIRINSPVRIDGNLNESVWKSATVITDFTENRPVYGRPQRPEIRTEVRVLYDNTALYIGAIMHNTSTDSIAKEVAQRDNVGNADFFMVFLDTYNTGINGFGFMVTTTNSQFDARYSNDNNGEDPSWNAVWESATRISGTDWVAEMKIPYSELRFPKKQIQTWGINFLNRRVKTQQDFFWNSVDPTKAGFVNQWGELDGIHDIDPPLRLSFTPYFSTYVDHYPYNLPNVKNTSVYVNGGMDVKYGINESFTLDATLIPDFGQVQSDNKILNLTPFEVKYNEYRSFFTEGTELFNKGGLFYSRRIGGVPIYYDSVNHTLQSGEKVVSNPSESKLINATKISGRTKSGLGIGFFNALTEQTYAFVENEQYQRRKVETDPLTNYNILVLDQSLKNNSSVSFINTNVTRFGSGYNADVAAGLFNLFTKNNKYNVNGQVTLSQLYGHSSVNSTGHYYMFSGGKTSGKFNATVGYSVMDDKYNPNDMGILFNNNEIDHTLNLSYNIVKPGKWYNNMFFNANTIYSRHFIPRSYQNFIINYNAFANLKNLWQINIFGDATPTEGNDFYEPRTTGRIYKTHPSYSFGFYVNTNRAKKYQVILSTSVRKQTLYNGTGLNLFFYQRYRFSNKFSLEHSINYNPLYNYAGYATTLSTPDSIIFGRRNVNTVEDILSGRYTFSSNMGVTVRLRHYVSGVNYKQYFLLNNEGRLDNTSYNGNNNINLNLFNVDFVYSWWFAPGSQISIAWKNSVQDYADYIIKGYVRNLDYSLKAPQENDFSLKILFYINYLNFKSHPFFKKRTYKTEQENN